MVNELRKVLGAWSAHPLTDRVLDNLDKEVSRSRIDTKISELQKHVDESAATEHSKAAYEEIASLLGSPGLSDEQRARLTTLRDKCLTNWEAQAYNDLLKVDKDKNYEGMGNRVNVYLDNSCPFRGKRSQERLQAVESLREWLRGFDQPKEYRITAIRVKDLPAPVWYENEWGGGYDPYVAVTIRVGDSAIKITAGAKDKRGSFQLASFITNNQFSWQKGSSIELVIWDDGVDEPDRCMGRIRRDDPYALLYLALPDRDVPVETERSDYKYNRDLVKLRLGLIVFGLAPPPPLPR
jgi:hypothetical protein